MFKKPSPVHDTDTGSNKPIIQDDTVDINFIITQIINNWLFYLISLISVLILSVIYLYYTPSDWNVHSKVLVKDQKNNPQSALSGTLSGDLGSLFNVKSNADNEIQVLRSRTLMDKTVSSMQLNIRTFSMYGFKKKEIFEESPFTISIVYKADTLLTRTYDIEVINQNSFIISNSKEDISKKVKFGEVIKLNQYNIRLNYKSGFKHGSKYQVAIYEPDEVIDAFSESFGAALSDKQATTVDLYFKYPHAAKGEAILNKLMQLYLLSNLQNEKQIADSTMAFIDARIALVSKELNVIEKQFERYKVENKIANISEQSKALVATASDFYDKLSQQEVQLKIIKDLEKYLNNPENKNIIPSSLINPVAQPFGMAVNGYNELLLTRDRASLSYTEDNPIILNIDKQLNNSRVNLLKQLETYKTSLQTGKDQLTKQNSGFTGELKKIPGKERNYLDFARQQNLKQELYLFLLQKREETAISRNSTISSSRIIDYAKSEYRPYKPKKSIAVAIALIIGVILPSIYLFIQNLLKIRIDTKSDIESVTNAPILGEIGHNNDKNSLVTGANSRSVISEQFRSLRTNLQFILDSSKPNVLLFTSSMSGEGKSFLSLNIGSALALTGKKVVFMELDLRKPKLSESVGLNIENGYTNYAISDDPDFTYKKLLKPLSFNKNCYLISSGPIPPNPAELLMSSKMEMLVDNLKEEFDYVIIDCAPVGLVTDALLLEKLSDLIFYVTRQGFTYKSQLNIVNDLIRVNKIKNLYLIVNDIKTQKAGYSSYRQSYGYGIEDENNSWFSKLFNKR